MVKQEKNDVIAAIGTPIGRGAISCVRLSGEGSADIVKKCTGRTEFAHGQMTSCTFHGKVRDRIMAVVYYGTKSYTGEESAELYFHGGVFLTEQALQSIVTSGARLAEPGEFTRRAFLSGKIDLTQAEGIGDLIDADGFAAAESAYEQSEGRTKRAIEALYKKVTEEAARAEVCIDYPEEDIEEQTREQLCAEINALCAAVQKEIDGYNGGRIGREGARVALVGKTNAGKSTLFNTLLMEERAIVSDEEGTTRDTIEEKMRYKGASFVLTDTAGLRETENRVEQMGIDRSKKAREKADIVVRVVKKTQENDTNSVESLDEKELIVLNSFQPDCTADKRTKDGKTYITLNARTGEGVDMLKEELYARTAAITATGGNINNPRQYAALVNAYAALKRAQTAVQTLTLDCVCADLCAALRSLGDILGKNASDSVVEEIFSSFCVGK